MAKLMISRSRWPLRSALAFYVIVPLVVAIGLTGTLLLRAFEEQVEAKMKEDVQLVARALEDPVSRALERDREGSLRSALQSAMGINRVYGVYVYGLDGRTLASAGAVNLAPDRRRLSSLASEAPKGEYEEISGQNVYSYFLPLITAGQRANGLLHITRRERDIRASVAELRARVAGLSAIAVLLVAGLVLLGHRGAIGRHLSALRGSMRRVESGDVKHRARRSGPDEIAGLADALNNMLDSIEQAEREIQVRREEQNDLKKRLRHAEKLAALGTLSAGVAHELGTPLSVIDGRAQRLLREIELPSDVERTLVDVRAQVRRMEHIIRQLLDLGRAPALQRRKIRVGFVVDSAVQSTAEAAAANSTRIGIHGDPSVTLHADPVQIEQVLTNLIRNAVDAASKGTVRVSWWNASDAVLIAVDDDGPGIRDDDRARVFEPFYTTKNVGDGTGLGLSVVHRIVEDHDGLIDVESSRLGGARFIVHLPVNDKAAVRRGRRDDDAVS